MDLRVIETLEELFKRAQFNTVDLESCNLEDEVSMYVNNKDGWSNIRDIGHEMGLLAVY